MEDTDPVYFWREYNGQHSYMSQWYPSPFHTGDPSGTIYLTAEQYMMHQKALLFEDHEIAAKILLTTDPGDQKALGRQVANFSQSVWEKNRNRIVEDGSYYKFKYGRDEGEGKGGPSMRDKLLATGDRELVEASPMDRIWGIGFGEKNAPKRRKDWGWNLLGKALTKTRDKLRAEEAREG